MTIYNIEKQLELDGREPFKSCNIGEKYVGGCSLNRIKRECGYPSRVKSSWGAHFFFAKLNLMFGTWCYSFMNLSVRGFSSCHTGSNVLSQGGMDPRALSSRCFREQGEHSAVGGNGTVCSVARFYFIY